MIKKDVISICNILADKMNESGKVAVQQIVAAIEDMKEETCEDCISTEMVIDTIKYYWINPQDFNFKDLIADIRALPSVQPSRPKGKWIHWTDDYKDYVTCSCCGYGEEGEVLLSDKTPFCPICGADMKESEE